MDINGNGHNGNGKKNGGAMVGPFRIVGGNVRLFNDWARAFARLFAIGVFGVFCGWSASAIWLIFAGWASGCFCSAAAKTIAEIVSHGVAGCVAPLAATLIDRDMRDALIYALSKDNRISAWIFWG